MIVGNGLIAKTLAGIEHSGFTIFASGVSNSSELNPDAFNREINLLLEQNKGKTLVYFSTCSVNDESLQETAYVKHKLTIESLIKNTFKDYIILRLPTVVGATNNPHTFFNHFKNKVINNEEVTIYKNAWRYLLDAEDLKILIPLILKNIRSNKKTIHVAYDNAMRVEEIIKQIDNFLLKASKIKLLDKGSHLHINYKELMDYTGNIDINSDPDSYNKRIIQKYLRY
jgi:nucleoside-diphosphate-sugar epimerase